MDEVALAAAIAVVSLIYATVGQAGGTAFLALMAVMSIPLVELRPTALALNVVASSYTAWRMNKARAIDWRLLALVSLSSMPAAFAGGLLVLENRVYYLLTGSVLIAAAALMVTRPRMSSRSPARPFQVITAGASVGLLAGMTGIGGGAFLAPLLIVMGWTTAREAAALSAPFILANSTLALAGTMIAGQQLAAGIWLYAAAAMAGAAAGALIGLRFMTERTTRYVLALVLAAAGIRLVAA